MAFRVLGGEVAKSGLESKSFDSYSGVLSVPLANPIFKI